MLPLLLSNTFLRGARLIRALFLQVSNDWPVSCIELYWSGKILSILTELGFLIPVTVAWNEGVNFFFHVLTGDILVLVSRLHDSKTYSGFPWASRNSRYITVLGRMRYTKILFKQALQASEHTSRGWKPLYAAIEVLRGKIGIVVKHCMCCLAVHEIVRTILVKH